MRTPRKKKIKTGRINAISVSRLYNTGNYTNVKYDLSCQIEKGESARATLLEMVRVIAALAPVSTPSCLDSLERCREKKLTERSEYEKSNYGDWLKQEADYNRKIAKRSQAVADLDRLGGTGIYQDHKLNWSDDDTPW